MKSIYIFIFTIVYWRSACVDSDLRYVLLLFCFLFVSTLINCSMYSLYSCLCILIQNQSGGSISDWWRLFIYYVIFFCNKCLFFYFGFLFYCLIVPSTGHINVPRSCAPVGVEKGAPGV